MARTPSSQTSAPAPAPAHTPYGDLGPEFIVLARLVWMHHEDRDRLLSLVDPASFTAKANRALFLTIARHADAGISPVALQAIVADEAPVACALFERIMGVDGTVAMEDDASSDAIAAALTAHGKVVKYRRSLQTALTSLDGETGYAGSRDELERQLASIDLAALSAKTYDDRTAMAAEAREFLTTEGRGGLTFGLHKLDERVGPVLPGHFVVIGGRPGTGKSTWLRNWTRYWVWDREEPTAYFSFEMTGGEKLPLLACLSGNISYGAYLHRTLTPRDQETFLAHLDAWATCPHFWLNDRSHVTPSWLLRTMKRYRAMGVRRFVLDHLHRVRYERSEKGEIRLSVAEFAGELKSFAVDHDATVVAGAQYTKGNKHEEPGDEMIKEAGEIIAEADKILHTWLPLVAGTRTGDGSFIPTQGGDGRRIFASDAPKGADVGMDPTRAFLLIGKQRARFGDGALSFPFNADTGRVGDLDEARLRRVS